MTKPTPERIALAGVTGTIGRSVVAAFRQQDRPDRAIGRSRTAPENVFGGDPLAELAAWDPESGALIRAALRGVAAAV